MPSPTTVRSDSYTASTATGARPSETSSSSSTTGLLMSARPIAVACCSPPERLPARRPRSGCSSGNASSTDSTFQRPGRRVAAPIRRFSSTVSPGNSRRPSGTSAIPIPTRR